VEDAREHDLVLWILEQHCDRPGQPRRTVAPRVEAGYVDVAREPSAVEVRDQAGEGTEERRLAGARTAEYQRDLSGGQTNGHVSKRGAGRARIRERPPLRDG